MHCDFCSLVTETLHLNEHEAASWLEKDELDSVKWLPADVLVVNEIFKRYKNPLEGAKLRSTMKKKKIVFA